MTIELIFGLMAVVFVVAYILGHSRGHDKGMYTGWMESNTHWGNIIYQSSKEGSETITLKLKVEVND